MCTIRIKNFGPIQNGYEENDGWMDIRKVTVLIGNQGSGKSTVAKLISIFTWMEKALVREDLRKVDITNYNRFKKKYCTYQNIHNFFKENTEIEYRGNAYQFQYMNGRISVTPVNGTVYHLPKVMYVPAERNFISAVTQPEKLRYLPLPLFTFLEEFIRSSEEITQDLDLPINNLSYKYDKKKHTSKLIGTDYEIALSESSSGLQSLIPLYIVSKNLAESIGNTAPSSKSKMNTEEMAKIREQLLKILLDKNLSEELKSTALDLLSKRTNNDCFINIVEEPEQNLYPQSQGELLKSLLKFNNINIQNKLILTTHSPFIINYLTLGIEAHSLKNKIANNEELQERANAIFPLKSTIAGSDTIIYELNEVDGSIQLLENYKGLPSDNNYLNNSLAAFNDQFAQLLDIEDLCQ